MNFAELTDVEIFATGRWNGQEFTTADLEEIVDNTNRFLSKGTNKPPLKFGHSKKQILDGQSDGDPALGWLENVRLAGNKIIANFKNVPNAVHKLIFQKSYDKVSVEMRHSPESGLFITATALLGADLPAVKTLDDLSNFLASDNEEASEAFCFSIAEPKFTNDGGHLEHPIEKEPMTEEVKQVDIKETVEFKEIEQKNQELEGIVAEFKAKENKLLFSAKKSEVILPYKEDIEKGLLLPAILEKIESEVDSQLGDFSEDSEILFSASLVREIAQSYSEKLPSGEKSNSEVIEESSNPSEVFSQKAKEIQVSEGKTYAEASEIVKVKHPELVKQVVEYNNKKLKG